ncbi:MAG: cytidylate kinase [Gammaproteobacteria bacterium]|nr:cytidylate kinase [Gammaproteobacteria bacterium]MYF37866.1 cytidylate kinase [Gammaproteobacteria bacterium]
MSNILPDKTVEPAVRDIPVIAIDGLAASGKGTVASEVATKLGWNLLDSGLLYRITAFLVKELDIAVDDIEAIESLLSHRVKIAYFNAGIDATQQDWLSESMIRRDRVFVLSDSQRQSYVRWNGSDITGTIRSDPISRIAARVASSPRVRRMLIPIQRQRRIMPGLVADGRDMGTVIFPDAQLKIFLEATPDTRARRRLQQLNLPDSEFKRIRDLMTERDQKDSLREVAPAIPAKDSVCLDSSTLSIAETVAKVFRLAQEHKLVNANSDIP